MSNNTKTIYYWLRIINDLSVETVANKLLISVSYVRAIENGKKIPSVRLLRSYANLFEVDENIIVKYSKETSKSIKEFLLSLLQEIT